jgi:hypothetical protein
MPPMNRAPKDDIRAHASEPARARYVSMAQVVEKYLCLLTGLTDAEGLQVLLTCGSA